MKIKFISNLIKIKKRQHLKDKILYLRAIIHLVRYFAFKSYRKNTCLIDPPMDFFINFGKIAKFFSIPLGFLAEYLRKKYIY